MNRLKDTAWSFVLTILVHNIVFVTCKCAYETAGIGARCSGLSGKRSSVSMTSSDGRKPCKTRWMSGRTVNCKRYAAAVAVMIVALIR